MTADEERTRICDIIARIRKLTPAVRDDGWSTYARLVEELTDRVQKNYPDPQWKYIQTSWQLPCGCIGPDIKSSKSLRQSTCTHCHRGWWHMGVRGGSCTMLDGQPQGEAVLILTHEMMIDK